MNKFRHITALLVFVIGLCLASIGIAFLMGTMSGISQRAVIWSFLFVIIGVLCGVLAKKHYNQTLNTFFAAFFILIGVVLFFTALNLTPLADGLSRGWPLLSVFAGLSLFPAGWRHYRSFRANYLIPAAAFVILGCVLLVFSLKIVSFSFKEFIINWWPLVLAFTGIVLVLLSLGSGQNRDADP
jgi:uncharacterized membrane protein